MLIAGLTGSIGMGKSTTAAMFAALGVPVWDADAAVHRLYGPGGAAVSPLSQTFPDSVRGGAVDRAALAQIVLGDAQKLAQLEAIVHPMVGADRLAFLDQARHNQAPVVILDIPLLFETGGNKAMDSVIVVSCAPELQRERVLARPGMSEEKFEAILARQVPDAEKRAMADFVIDTGQGLDHARQSVASVLQTLRESALSKEISPDA